MVIVLAVPTRAARRDRWSVWRIPLLTGLVGHVLLVPLYLAARRSDLARVPLGEGHWPGEPAWPAGSGSSEWGPGVLPVLVSWLVLWVLVLLACLAALVVALDRLDRDRR